MDYKKPGVARSVYKPSRELAQRRRIRNFPGGQTKGLFRIVRKGKNIKSYPVTDAQLSHQLNKLTHNFLISNVDDLSNPSIALVPPQSPDPIRSPIIILELTGHAQGDPILSQGDYLELGPQVDAPGL